MNADSVAEYVISSSLSLLKKTKLINEKTQSGQWPRTSITTNELKGKTLGLIGFGDIAKKVLKLINAFEVTTIAFDPFITSQEMQEHNVKKVTFENILSLALFSISIIFITFKGLNYGIDFKGGTLIELRSNNTEASSIRDVLKNMNLGDVNVKKFGQKGDYLIKVEQTGDNNKLIPEIKKSLSDNLTSEVNFRRVENVGPKVSAELLQSGVIALSLIHI